MKIKPLRANSTFFTLIAGLILGVSNVQSAILVENSVVNSNDTTLSFSVTDVTDSYIILATSGNNPATSFSVDGTPMNSVFSQLVHR
jgi:hypothetical protein